MQGQVRKASGCLEIPSAQMKRATAKVERPRYTNDLVMTYKEIYAAKPGPELDALVHRYYGGGSTTVPHYSTDLQTAIRLAQSYGLDLSAAVVGGRVIMSLLREGRGSGFGDEIDLEGTGEIDIPPAIFAALAARSMLKLCRAQSARDSSAPSDFPAKLDGELPPFAAVGEVPPGGSATGELQ